MRIAFIDYSTWEYTAGTPEVAPLGGSQSALCYLSRELAALRHEVTLVTAARRATVERGVRCVPHTALSGELLGSLDAAVVLNIAKRGLELRERLGDETQLILWTQHATDQPAVAALARPEVRGAFDAMALVSQWQRKEYLESFEIEPARAAVLRNAVAPAFERLFEHGENILATKCWPPVLAYTSTPFRGLERLIDLFPRIKAEVRGAVLRVYSSMKVYQVDDRQDEARYGRLYERCRATPGVQYVGGLSQPDLARALKQASVLAYPNTFAETSCIAVMEALAAGALVATSRLGALDETAAGFARLVNAELSEEQYADRFVEAALDAIESFEAPRRELTALHLARQVAFAQAANNWRRRAIEWESWLEALVAADRRRAA